MSTPTVHDPAIVKMAELSRLADEWFDADNRVRDYLTLCAAFDRPLNHENVRVLHQKAEAAKAAYFAAVQG